MSRHTDSLFNHETPQTRACLARSCENLPKAVWDRYKITRLGTLSKIQRSIQDFYSGCGGYYEDSQPIYLVIEDIVTTEDVTKLKGPVCKI